MTDTSSGRPNMPLAGVTVIDLGQIYQGPYATLLMAKAGAHVIKVEPPEGDVMRHPGNAPTPGLLLTALSLAPPTAD